MCNWLLLSLWGLFCGCSLTAYVIVIVEESGFSQAGKSELEPLISFTIPSPGVTQLSPPWSSECPFGTFLEHRLSCQTDLGSTSSSASDVLNRLYS